MVSGAMKRRTFPKWPHVCIRSPCSNMLLLKPPASALDGFRVSFDSTTSLPIMKPTPRTSPTFLDSSEILSNSTFVFSQCPHPLQQVRPLDVVDRGRPCRHPE